MNRVLLCLVPILALVHVPFANGQCGDPPDNLDCYTARDLPGYPGTHEVEIDATAAFVTGTEPAPQCGLNVGHTVWFRVTPVVDGTIVFTTCHPTTSYDTVVQAYLGDCGGFLYGPPEWCNDDDLNGSGCTNSCYALAPRSSTVTITDVVAGNDYYFQVGSYNNNSAGCVLCLGVYVTVIDRCDSEITPPVAVLTTPPALGAGCACLNVDVTGTADDPDGTFESYWLEYSTPSGGAWTLIQNGTTPVNSGVLGNWNTGSLPQGYYVLRLTVRNTCGMESTAVRAVFLDGYFDTLDFRYPPVSTGDPVVVGGQVCFEGTIADTWCFSSAAAEYRPVGGGAFQPVDPGMPFIPGAVNEPFAVWDTIGLAVPDGDYELRVWGETVCGNGASATRVVTVDNTLPTAVITNPLNCDPVDGVVQIMGTANDANLDAWVLQVTGGPYNGWTLIDSDTVPVVGGVLTPWNTSTLPACEYTLRLVVYDKTVRNCASPIRQSSEHMVSVSIGSCPGDLDGDGQIGLSDLAALLAVYGTACP